MAWPRAMTARMASASDKTPAWQAAAYSPMLWPIMACGLSPKLSSQVASAWDTANSAGCACRVSARLAAAEALPASASTSQVRSFTARSAGASVRHCSKASRKAGTWSHKPRAMPGCCEPWPGNRKTSLGLAGGMALETFNSRKAATAEAASLATTATRCAMGWRPRVSVAKTLDSGVSGWRSRCLARSWARCNTACDDFADKGSKFNRPAASSSGTACTGASSSTTWALVPPTPKELTAARRTCGPRGQARACA